MQNLHFRFHANFFLLPWKIPEEIPLITKGSIYHIYMCYDPAESVRSRKQWLWDIARKRNMTFFCFLCFENPSIAFWTIGPIQVGFSTKCTSPNEHFTQIENLKNATWSTSDWFPKITSHILIQPFTMEVDRPEIAHLSGTSCMSWTWSNPSN